MTRPLALLVALCLPAVFSNGQEVPAESSEKPIPPATPATSPAEELPGESLGLIPEAPKNTAKPKSESSQPKKKSSTEQASDDLQGRIRYREARTRALQDPRFQQEWERAQASKTEPEKREALKAYYKLLFDRIVKLDVSTKPHVEQLRKSLGWRLDPGSRQRAKVEQRVEEQDRDETVTQIR